MTAGERYAARDATPYFRGIFTQNMATWESIMNIHKHLEFAANSSDCWGHRLDENNDERQDLIGVER